MISRSHRPIACRCSYSPNKVFLAYLWLQAIVFGSPKVSLAYLWLQAIVFVDHDLDLRIEDSSTDDNIRQIHEYLTKHPPHPDLTWTILGGLGPPGGSSSDEDSQNTSSSSEEVASEVVNSRGGEEQMMSSSGESCG